MTKRADGNYCTKKILIFYVLNENDVYLSGLSVQQKDGNDGSETTLIVTTK